MKSYHKFILFSLLSFPAIIGACHSNKSSNFHLIDLLIDSTGKSDSWGGDVHLSVNGIKQLDTSIEYDLQALYKGKPVGFKLEVPKNVNQNNNGFGTGIVIKSDGEKSDDFRDALIDIYKVKANRNRKFIKEIKAEFVELGQFAKSTAGQAREDGNLNDFKLFFDVPGGEEAEIFLNISKDQKIVELREKDEEYRSLIIQGLTESLSH